MKVSSRQGSWRCPVMRHRSSYIAYGSRPGHSLGVLIPRRRVSAAMTGLTLGMSSRRAISSRLGGRVFDGLFICFILRNGSDHAAIDTERAPLVAEVRGLHTYTTIGATSSGAASLRR